jgi:hypothetical protein
MSFGGQTFRAFRPSRFAQPDELEEEHQEAKQAKIRIYIKRAEAGMPLFEQPNIAKALAAGQDLVM